MALLGATSIAVAASCLRTCRPILPAFILAICSSCLHFVGHQLIFALTQVLIFSARMLNFKSYRGKQKPFRPRIYQWYRKFSTLYLIKITTLLVVFIAVSRFCCTVLNLSNELFPRLHLRSSCGIYAPAEHKPNSSDSRPQDHKQRFAQIEGVKMLPHLTA